MALFKFNLVGLTLATLLGHVSCHTMEQGYWTKQNLSQALTNEQYPNDSRECEAIAAKDGGQQSEEYQPALYTKCMQARGYEWVTERHLSQAVMTTQNDPLQISLCPAGRLIVDALGYQRCVPNGGKGKGTPVNESSHRPVEAVSSWEKDRSSIHVDPPNQQRHDDHEFCLQYAKDSLSSPYSVYAQCMQNKGWPTGL